MRRVPLVYCRPAPRSGTDGTDGSVQRRLNTSATGGDALRCGYLDSRSEFFQLIAAKMGCDFSFTPVQDICRDVPVPDCDVVVLGIHEQQAISQWADQTRLLAHRLGHIPLIAFIRHPEQTLIRELIAAGAYDCFVETSSLEELRIILRRAVHHSAVNRELDLIKSQHTSATFGSLVARSARMTSLFAFASRVAESNASVILVGETGTGKEVLARAIHDQSHRAREPFVAVACASLPETLIEAELFGHEKGAFTNAASLRKGRFESAGKGTIFLDEIGELSLSLQVKLLRVLQERSFERLGSNQPRSMDARVICATHRDLRSLVREGTFRSDLFYRLNTIELSLPALRNRREDIPGLANFFLQSLSERHNRQIPRLAPISLRLLENYSWPGNVRELEHVIERALILCDSHEIRPEHLPIDITVSVGDELTPSSNRSFDEEVRLFKRQLLERQLQLSGNNKMQAARALGISRSSIHRLMEELALSPRNRMLN
jgi:DNA-binding NtrC family response regulator